MRLSFRTKLGLLTAAPICAVGLFTLGAGCSSTDTPAARRDPAPQTTAPTATSTAAFTRLPGGVHGLARPQFDVGRTDPGMKLENLTLAYKLTPAQKADKAALLAQVNDPASPSFHRWLTPEEYGARFGASAADQAKVQSWLQSQGFRVTRTARASTHVFFDGTVAQIEAAFRTEMHDYEVKGKRSFGLSIRPSVPSELASVIVGVRGTHSFKSEAPKRELTLIEDDHGNVNPEYNSKTPGKHALSPDDFTLVYDVGPLYGAATPIDGTGTTIAIIGRTSLIDADNTAFRTRFGLPAPHVTTLLVPSTGPAVDLGTNENVEAELDIQWSGAIAKNANVVFVQVGGAANTDNIDTAMQYAIDVRAGDVMSISFGGCEPAYAGYEGELTQFADQAALEGITVLAASGDAGAATCDQGGAVPATNGLTVSMPAAVPGITAVGGTSFNDNPAATYWQTTMTDAGESAIEYIPETAWNDCDPTAAIPCVSAYAATGGGLSQLYPKPFWQIGPGVPADGQRDVPDIALEGGSHVPVLVHLSEGVTTAGLYGISGTSVATPSLAGVLGLVNQSLLGAHKIPRTGLGNINPTIYSLAKNVPSAFHDITVGNNIVACDLTTQDCVDAGVPNDAGAGGMGYKATPGYDLTTGVGSIDVAKFVDAWKGLAPTSIGLVALPTTQTEGQAVKLTATVTSTVVTAAPSGEVQFFDQGGVQIGVGAVTGAAGVGTATASVTTLPAGRDQVFAAYSGDTNFLNSFTLATVDIYDIDAGCDDAGSCDHIFGPTHEDGGTVVVIVPLATDSGTDSGPANDDAGPVDSGTDAGAHKDSGTGPGKDASTPVDSSTPEVDSSTPTDDGSTGGVDATVGGEDSGPGTGGEDAAAEAGSGGGSSGGGCGCVVAGAPSSSPVNGIAGSMAFAGILALGLRRRRDEKNAKK